MTNLWAGGCYACAKWSGISVFRQDAREWARTHRRTCKANARKGARIYRVVLVETK